MTVAEAGGGQRRALRAKTAQHLIKGSTQLEVARTGLASPETPTQQQLFLTAAPAFALKDPSQGSVIKGRQDRSRTPPLVDSPQHLGEGLIQAWIPGHIPEQLQHSRLAAFC